MELSAVMGFIRSPSRPAGLPRCGRAADEAFLPLFINARADLFLRESNRERHGELMGEALERAEAYAEAGAGGFFPICLVDRELIAKVCSAVSNPVNILILPGAPAIPALTEIGVSRISHGGGPHRQTMAALADRYREVIGK